jgi:DNA-binding NarL/FixJ family response regulator
MDARARTRVTDVVVADDFPALRRGLIQVLERQDDLRVAGEAGTGPETMELVRRVEPDLLVLDLGMPGVRGYELLRELRAEHPDMAILVFTMQPEDEAAIPALKAGARGFLSKQASADEIVLALRTVAEGRRYLSESLTELMVDSMPIREEAPPHASLSDRELDVLQRVANGEKPAEIAEHLGISAKTVQTYRGRILDKLDLRTTADLVRYALEHRLLGWASSHPEQQ